MLEAGFMPGFTDPVLKLQEDSKGATRSLLKP